MERSGTHETSIPQAFELPEEAQHFGPQDLDNFPEVKDRVKPTEGVLQFQLDFKNFDKKILKRHADANFTDAYDTIAATRGLCLIINNKNFTHLDERIGTDVDCTNLDNLFTQLGYKVDILRDQTAAQMRDACRKFILDPMHEFHVSCALIILSHGTMGKIFGSDSQSIDEKNDILDYFNDPSCGLNGKPKLFIVQACRTQLATKDKETQHSRGSLEDADGGSREDKRDNEYLDLVDQMRELNHKDSGHVESLTPDCADLLIAHSTLPGYVSWRNQKQGTWFVQALVQIFSRYFHEEHAADMLVMANKLVSDAFGQADRAAPMPAPTNLLRKKLYFFPLSN